MVIFCCLFVQPVVNLFLCLPCKASYLMCMVFPDGKNLLSMPQAVVSLSCFYNYPCKQGLCLRFYI